MASTQQRNVVVAVDASEYSDQALQFYLRTLHQPHYHVCVITCPEYSFAHGDYEMSAARLEQDLLDARAATEALKTKYLSELTAKGIPGEFAVVDSKKPGEAICEYAKDQNAVMLVTGTRGLGKIRRTILGSVSDYVVHHSEVPVLVCRHHH